LDFGASILVVGGSIALAWDAIYQPLRFGMSQSWPGWSEMLVIVPAQRIEEAALVGAAWHAVRAASTDPSR
jgi:hypothetical protein